MVLEEKKVKNICNFYVSEYHLEIMLLPYISKKIDNEENITIITEIDLESTLNVVIERINLDKDKKEKVLEDINNAASFIRGKLSERIEIRHTPELKFIYDDSIEYGEKIEKIIDKLHKEKQN